MRILFVEDDVELTKTLKLVLTKDYTIDLAYSGEEGEFKALNNEYDLIILDYLLPDTDGIKICKKIRKMGINTPILLLTGETSLSKKVIALDLGADDYLTKPFDIEELQARVRALLRRRQRVESNIIQVDGLTFDLLTKDINRDGNQIKLRKKELLLLEYLMKHTGKVITREMIVNYVWDNGFEASTNVIDVHIKYLRDKIDKGYPKKLIKTVHSFGYKIEI